MALQFSPTTFEGARASGNSTQNLSAALGRLKPSAGEGEMLETLQAKIKALAELSSLVADLRRQGKRIVFTNGCFDLLHAGHVTYLAQAKSLGDVLIVGLNSDASVRALKGSERPLVPQEDRALLLASLSFVDFVVIFDELTPHALLQTLKPDVHVKGGDYTEDDLPEAPLVRSYGGQIVILPKVEGRSTTELMRRIRKGEGVQSVRKVVGIIPARYASVRFPGKVLASLWGKPIVQHVYERAKRAKSLSEVLVATDDERVKAVVESFGGECVMTSPHHPSGTDRIAEVAERLDADVVVNIQGDEPLIAPEAIDAAVQPFFADPTLKMTTLATPIADEGEYRNPNVVKVVTDRDGFALYFSRSPLPFFRPKGTMAETPSFAIPDDAVVRPLRHIGLYAYRREFLLQFAQWAPTALERAEGLEQLRALEHGVRIKVVITPYRSVGVDTPDDLERLNRQIPP
jgi:3-deoxy-manno-octulosonate cytidylyltransferase (CMP-KDO synthetase)